jgi:uncharacterized membrane protein YeiB
VALLAMFVAHFGIAGTVDSRTWQENVVHFTDGRAMPLFILLSGCGVAFLLARSVHPWREMTGRSIVLLLIGLLFAGTQPVAVILQAYAVYFLLAVAIGKLPSRWLPALAAAVTAAGALSVMFLADHLPSARDHRDLVSDTWGSLPLLAKPHVLVSDIFVTGYYPVLPNLAFLIVGMWLTRTSLTSRRMRWGLVSAGLVLAIVGYGSGMATEARRDGGVGSTTEGSTVGGDVSGVGVAGGDGTFESNPSRWWDLLDQTGHSHMPAWVVGATGWCLVVVGLCLFLAAALPRASAPFAALGRISLTAYVAHLALFRWPLAAWPFDLGQSQALALVLAGWLAMCFVAWAWTSWRVYGPLEYLMRGA